MVLRWQIKEIICALSDGGSGRKNGRKKAGNGENKKQRKLEELIRMSGFVQNSTWNPRVHQTLCVCTGGGWLVVYTLVNQFSEIKKI